MPPLQILETCHATWVLDPGRDRFHRIVRTPGARPVVTGWRPYFGLQVDRDGQGFAVLLDPEGRRRWSARRHPPDCGACQVDPLLRGDRSLVSAA